MVLRYVVAIIGLLVGASAAAADELGWSAPLAVAAVPAGDRLQLEDGREVRLAGIRVPREAREDAGSARRARDALAGLAAGRDGPPRHRRGSERSLRAARRPGRARRRPVAAGRPARARAWPRSRPGRARPGAPPRCWRSSARRGRPAAGSGATRRSRRAPPTGSPMRSAAFRSCGARWCAWRRPSTTSISISAPTGAATSRSGCRRRELVEGFARSGLEIEQLAGRVVEVRGYVLDAGGPLIEVSHPEQLEVLR